MISSVHHHYHMLQPSCRFIKLFIIEEFFGLESLAYTHLLFKNVKAVELGLVITTVVLPFAWVVY